MSNSLQDHREDVELLQVAVSRYLYEWRHFIREWEVPDSARAADWREFTPYKERPTIGWSHELHLREGLSKVLQRWHFEKNLGLDAQAVLDLRRFVEWESDSRPEPNLPNQSTLTVSELLGLCERVASQLDLVLVSIDRSATQHAFKLSLQNVDSDDSIVSYAVALAGDPSLALPPTPKSTLGDWISNLKFRELLGTDPKLAPKLQRLRISGLRQLHQRRMDRAEARKRRKATPKPTADPGRIRNSPE